MPLDPPLMRNRSWDALSDSLWEGLDSLADKEVAVIWPGWAEMADSDPQSFDIAARILEDLTESLADAEATVGHPKEIAVLLA